MKLHIHEMLECPSVRPSVRGHSFVWSFSPTVLHVLLLNLYLKFVKTCMCNFHDHTIIGCGIIFS